MAAIIDLIDYADGFKIIDYEELVESNYKGCIIDLAMEDYFGSVISNQDNLNKVVLNPAHCSHREKFAESLEEQLEIYALEDNLQRMEITCLNYEIETVDSQIVSVLNTTTKKVEGMMRIILFSQKKKCSVTFKDETLRNKRGSSQQKFEEIKGTS